MSVEDFIAEMDALIANFDVQLEMQVPKSTKAPFQEVDDSSDEELNPTMHEAYNKLIKDYLQLLDENDDLKKKLKQKKKSWYYLG